MCLECEKDGNAQCAHGYIVHIDSICCEERMTSFGSSTIHASKRTGFL
jgi:hypothetical protein